MNKEKEIIENLEKDTEDLAEDAEDYLEHLQRLQAEFNNFQKRVQKEKETLLQFANKELLLQLLEIHDNFERVLKSEGDIKNGVEMIFKQFDDLLKKEGVTEVSNEGEFDPNLHEAVSKEGDDNKITEVFQKGYTLKEKLLRPSKVKLGGEKNE